MTRIERHSVSSVYAFYAEDSKQVISVSIFSVFPGARFCSSFSSFSL